MCVDGTRCLLVCVFSCSVLSLLPARPWLLIRELVVRCWLSCPPVVLRLACAPSCFVSPFYIVALRRVVSLVCFFLACVCSVVLSVCCIGGAWGVFLFFCVSAFALDV